VRKLIFAIGFFVTLVATPVVVHANWSTLWQLPNDIANQRLAADRAVLTPVPGGLRVQSQPNGGIGIFLSVSHRIDGIRIVFANSQPVPTYFVWHRKNDPEGVFVQFPVRLSGQPGEEISLPLTAFPTWDPWSNLVGLRFPEGADVTLSQIEFGGWTLSEKIREGIRSFFVIDSLNAYSINFLWGPLIGTTPQMRSQLFDSQPPIGYSINRYFYYLLFIVAAVVILWTLYERFSNGRDCKRTAITIFFSVFFLLWLVFDARMGAELLVNFTHDVQTFVLKPSGEKQFRNQQNFNDAIERSLPLLTSVSRYATYVQEGAPIAKQVWYATYPTSRHLTAQETPADAEAFFVFRRTDYAVDDKGQLLHQKSDGTVEVLAKSGSIMRFDDYSFLYKPAK
jgi:hypothetical protein